MKLLSFNIICLLVIFNIPLGFAKNKTQRGLIKSGQLLVVTATSMSASSGRLQRFSRGKKGWHTVGASIRVHLGRNGLGWGRGLHSMRGKSGPIKREGDGKAPAGIFRLGHAFGYKPFRTLYPYRVYGKKHHCVDDVKSRFYNRIINSRTVKKDYKSFEKMRLPNHYYKYGITVNHNRLLGGKPKRGAGSCIFLHVKHIPTAGCTVMKQSQLKRTIRWLDRGKRPLLVQGTRAQVKRLMKRVGG